MSILNLFGSNLVAYRSPKLHQYKLLDNLGHISMTKISHQRAKWLFKLLCKWKRMEISSLRHFGGLLIVNRGEKVAYLVISNSSYFLRFLHWYLGFFKQVSHNYYSFVLIIQLLLNFIEKWLLDLINIIFLFYWISISFINELLII